jgi:hypothetical protein
VEEIANKYLDFRLPNGTSSSDTYVMQPQLDSTKIGSRVLICGEMKNSGTVFWTRPFRIERLVPGGPPEIIFSYPGNPTSGNSSFSVLLELDISLGWVEIPMPRNLESKLNKNQPNGYAGLNANSKVPYTQLEFLSAKAINISSWTRSGGAGNAAITTTTPHNLTNNEVIKVTGTRRTAGVGPILDGTYSVWFAPSPTVVAILIPSDGLNSSGVGGTIYTGGIISADDKQKIENNNSAITSNSANWNTAYTNLVSNSAAYLSAVDISLLAVDISLLAAASGSWNSNYTTSNTNSANWSSVYTTTNSNSGNWDEAYTNLVANSAVYLQGGGPENVYILSSFETALSADQYSVFIKSVTAENVFTYNGFTSGRTVTIFLSASHSRVIGHYFPSNTYFNNNGNANLLYTFEGYTTQAIILNTGNYYFGSTQLIPTQVSQYDKSLGDAILQEDEFGFLLQEDDDRILQG